jgi:hypothetical protein
MDSATQVLAMFKRYILEVKCLLLKARWSHLITAFCRSDGHDLT